MDGRVPLLPTGYVARLGRKIDEADGFVVLTAEWPPAVRTQPPDR